MSETTKTSPRPLQEGLLKAIIAREMALKTGDLARYIALCKQKDDLTKIMRERQIKRDLAKMPAARTSSGNCDLKQSVEYFRNRNLFTGADKDNAAAWLKTMAEQFPNDLKEIKSENMKLTTGGKACYQSAKIIELVLGIEARRIAGGYQLGAVREAGMSDEDWKSEALVRCRAYDERECANSEDAELLRFAKISAELTEMTKSIPNVPSETKHYFAAFIETVAKMMASDVISAARFRRCKDVGVEAGTTGTVTVMPEDVLRVFEGISGFLSSNAVRSSRRVLMFNETIRDLETSADDAKKRRAATKAAAKAASEAEANGDAVAEDDDSSDLVEIHPYDHFASTMASMLKQQAGAATIKINQATKRLLSGILYDFVVLCVHDMLSMFNRKTGRGSVSPQNVQALAEQFFRHITTAHSENIRQAWLAEYRKAVTKLEEQNTKAAEERRSKKAAADALAEQKDPTLRERQQAEKQKQARERLQKQHQKIESQLQALQVA